MPSIREMSAAPPRRLIVRIAIAVGFVLAIYLYVAHDAARSEARAKAAGEILASVARNDTASALAHAVAAQRSLGGSPALARSTWAALMAGGGPRGRYALLRRSFAFTPSDPNFRLEFGAEGRFLAAIDGNRISVWNVENGQHVLTAQAGDRFVGYWRIAARHFGLLASYQYYDLVNSVIELPDGFRYAQPSKDSLTAVAPGGDWGWRAPSRATGRTDYPIKLVNLHTGEKREVDAGYGGAGAVAVNADATRIAAIAGTPGRATLWNARTRTRIAAIACGGQQLYFSKALGAVVAFGGPAQQKLCFAGANDGKRLFSLQAPDAGTRAVADDPRGLWFAIQTGGVIKLYRGPNAPLLPLLAEREVSRPAPATSH